MIREMDLDDLAPVFHLGEQVFTAREVPNLYIYLSLNLSGQKRTSPGKNNHHLVTARNEQVLAAAEIYYQVAMRVLSGREQGPKG